ncbi:ferredoxin [Mobilitalea sibirica]|uniref:Ferredoxin n=1 Tax=Mobilitalea sibirica TaxID=1462919 RepID=A0A8J7H4P0_9FIRM|nr:ferredoxin [Mobilitalea sibirica]MBH1939571.1 ferredoxin [Mobilitalea sibirica]
MRAEIDREGCISCGLCVSTCPDVFRMGNDGPAEVYVDTVPPEAEDLAMEASENCPVAVISVE